MYKIKAIPLAAGIAAVVLSGCSTTKVDGGKVSSEDYRKLQTELKAKEDAIAAKEQQIQNYRNQLSQSQSSQGQSQVATQGDLLPPSAKPGECYARVWVPAAYRTVSKEVLVQEASDRVEIIPAKYEWVEEQVLVKAASSEIRTTPAVYTTKKESILVKDATRVWKTGLGPKASPASDELLSAAKAHGVDIAAATPGMCFHEHYRPAQYTTETNQVEVSPASVELKVVPAKYRYVEKSVMVREAGSEVRDIPAQYEWVEEKVLDKPAHTVWQKGTGPIQKIDEATGEIMCLVEIPATYKTIRKRVLKTAARTEKVEIPAEYKTVKVRELVSPAKEEKVEVPAEYKTIKVSKQASGPTFVWHEVHDTTEPATTRTGAKICLTEKPAQYQTVVRRVVETPASSQTVEIPAEYKTVKVRKLVSAAEERRISVPAEYKTVTLQELESDGHMQWRSILCKTNMTLSRISAIQTALDDAGYNPGPIDGVIGAQTMQAINAFQRDKGLPVDEYVNLETLNALGVSAR